MGSSSVPARSLSGIHSGAEAPPSKRGRDFLGPAPEYAKRLECAGLPALCNRTLTGAELRIVLRESFLGTADSSHRARVRRDAESMLVVPPGRLSQSQLG